jgi:hypothetical protein
MSQLIILTVVVVVNQKEMYTLSVLGALQLKEVTRRDTSVTSTLSSSKIDHVTRANVDRDSPALLQVEYHCTTYGIARLNVMIDLYNMNTHIHTTCFGKRGSP